MSSPDQDGPLKAGHPPAVKAGGMRITQHKNPEKEREIKLVKDPEDSKPSTSPPKAATIISGVHTKGHADFPKEAIQHFHEKPVPTHDARTAHSRPVVIQQPRK